MAQVALQLLRLIDDRAHGERLYTERRETETFIIIIIIIITLQLVAEGLLFVKRRQFKF